MDAILAATRFLTWVLLLANLAILGHYLRHRINGGDSVGSSVAITATTSFVLQTTGWALHQIYWWHWQMARVADNAVLTKIVESGQGLSLAGFALMTAGSLLLTSIYIRRIVAWPFWPVVIIVSPALIWSIGYRLTT